MNYSYEIVQDEYPADPRKEFDHLGTMLCLHSKYLLGDFPELRLHEFKGLIKAYTDPETGEFQGIKFLLWLYDHSGITIRASESDPFTAFDSACWDHGQIGIIYVSHEDIQREFGAVNKDTLSIARAVLLAEVEEYDQYLTGDVWGYVVTDETGEEVESCFGFFGYDFCEQEAQTAAAYLENQDKHLQFD